jgi:hypothetical protein
VTFKVVEARTRATSTPELEPLYLKWQVTDVASPLIPSSLLHRAGVFSCLCWQMTRAGVRTFLRFEPQSTLVSFLLLFPEESVLTLRHRPFKLDLTTSRSHCPSPTVPPCAPSATHLHPHHRFASTSQTTIWWRIWFLRWQVTRPVRRNIFVFDPQFILVSFP